MIKVLVANKNIKNDFNSFQFLTKNNEFEIETSCTGIETIEKYKISKPSIIILDSNIADMSYTDIIDKISMFPEEDEKVNMILTLKDKKDKLLLENASKIYKILDDPLDTDKFESTLKSMKEKFEKPKITTHEIRYLFTRLGLAINSEGANFMISAIFKNYYSPEKYPKLNDILLSIAEDYNIPKDVVRNRLRTFLNTFNNSYNIDEHKTYIKIFGHDSNITPKSFLDDFIAYLNMKKNNIDL